jgi:hypothetical protein
MDNMHPISMVERTKKEHGEEKGKKRRRHKYYIYGQQVFLSLWLIG